MNDPKAIADAIEHLTAAKDIIAGLVVAPIDTTDPDVFEDVCRRRVRAHYDVREAIKSTQCLADRLVKPAQAMREDHIDIGGRLVRTTSVP